MCHLVTSIVKRKIKSRGTFQVRVTLHNSVIRLYNTNEKKNETCVHAMFFCFLPLQRGQKLSISHLKRSSWLYFSFYRIDCYFKRELFYLKHNLFTVRQVLHHFTSPNKSELTRMRCSRFFDYVMKMYDLFHLCSIICNTNYIISLNL